MKVELGPHERLDDLCLDGMKIIQRDDEFCFSLDTVVLAHFGAVPKGHILDMGTGTAAIPLILAARGARQITAVELNPVMADIARRNIALNGKGHCITVKEGDYRHIRAMRSVAIEPKCLRFIHGKAGKDAKLFLVEGIRGGHAGLQVAPPLFVHDDDGSYGSEILAMYGKT